MSGNTYHLYCDETSTGKGHSYMAIGGLMLHASRAQSLAASVADWRERVNMKSELKWKKVSRQKYAHYEDFARGTLHYIDKRHMCFRCMALDQRIVNYKEFHDDNENLGYNRFLYWLILRGFLPFMEDGSKLYIFPDERPSDSKVNDESMLHPLEELRRCLNRAAARDFGWSSPPVANIQHVTSKKSTIMQMNDVLLGAVGHQLNRRELVPGCDQAKVNLAAFVAARAGLRDLRASTPASMTHFNIWHLRLAQKKAPQPLALRPVSRTAP